MARRWRHAWLIAMKQKYDHAIAMMQLSAKFHDESYRRFWDIAYTKNVEKEERINK